MKKKRRARELALQTLYACETGAADDRFQILESIGESGGYGDESREYARLLVTAAWDGQERIDDCIARHTVNWNIRRMAAVDRNLLRLAMAELGMEDRTPPKVVIDEAVELAKTYSTEESSRFVNGVLDSMYREMNNKTTTERKL
jgi:N utilization substance protein B